MAKPFSAFEIVSVDKETAHFLTRCSWLIANTLFRSVRRNSAILEKRGSRGRAFLSEAVSLARSESSEWNEEDSGHRTWELALDSFFIL